MTKYNELKIQCFMAETLLSSLGIVVNVKTLSTLLDKPEINIHHHIHRMTPRYYTKYADKDCTYGCLFKYRTSRVVGKGVREKLGLRYLLNQHLNLRKNAATMNYDGFYFFDGIDDFRYKYGIDLRELILKKVKNNTSEFEKYKNHYGAWFDLSPNSSPSIVILTNYKQYKPYTDRTIIEKLETERTRLKEINSNTNDEILIRENNKRLYVIGDMIAQERAKFECFTG